METTVSHHGLANRIWRICIWSVLMFGTSCAPSGSVVTVSASRPVVIVAPSESVLQINDTALVAVTVENIADLIAFEAHLSFDPNLLEVIELKDGRFVEPDFIVQNIFDNVTGTIDYAVAQIDQPPANGSGILFEVVFRAKAHGQVTIHFRETQAAPTGLLLSDPNGMAIEVTLIDGNVKVSGP